MCYNHIENNLGFIGNGHLLDDNEQHHWRCFLVQKRKEKKYAKNKNTRYCLYNTNGPSYGLWNGML